MIEVCKDINTASPYAEKGNSCEKLYAPLAVTANSSSSTPKKLSPAASPFETILMICGNFTRVDPATIAVPNPLEASCNHIEKIIAIKNPLAFP